MQENLRLKTTVTRIARGFNPKILSKRRNVRNVLVDVSEQLGLVYFGYVNQQDDEHRLIRGFTASTTHTDNHYCIGSFKSYDLALAVRTDTVPLVGGRPVEYTWLVVQVDLKQVRDLPPVIAAHQSESDLVRSKFTQLMPLTLGNYIAQDPLFAKNYVVYGQPAHQLLTEYLFPPQVASVIASHFGNASLEITGDCVYVVQPTSHPSRSTIEKTISNAIWMAEVLDAPVAVQQESHEVDSSVQ